MARAQLLVERGSLRDRSEDWGAFDFLQLPSPADRIQVRRGNETHYLTVLCVHHQPVPAGEGEAAASVVAKWTGSG